MIDARSNRHIGVLHNKPFPAEGGSAMNCYGLGLGGKVLVSLVTLVAFLMRTQFTERSERKLYVRIKSRLNKLFSIIWRDVCYRWVAAATLIAFLFTSIPADLGYAYQAAPAPIAAAPIPQFKELNPSTFTLPGYLGSIKDSWIPFERSTQNAVRSTIIHIQDAHCNYYAQHKIAEIVEYLNKEYGVNTINLEGGAKDYDLSIFTNIADKTIRAKAADHFVKEGLVNGSEYFAINNPDKVSLWGVEDTKLYIDNLNAYRNSLKYKAEIGKDLKALSYILTNLKVRIYPKDLLELDAKYIQYKAGNIEFKEYLNYLIEKAKDKSVDINALTDIQLLGRALDEEGTIDFRQANNERDAFIDKLEKKLSKNSLEELVLKTVEFKKEKISQTEFYSYLTGKAKLVNLDISEFAEFEKYIAYISLYGAIDQAKVTDELDLLEVSLKNALFENDKEKELDRLSKNLALTKNIFNISITPSDYKFYKENEESFGIANYVKFINREAPLYKITAGLDDNIGMLDQYREDMARFYEYSLARDQAFIKNIRLAYSVERIAYSEKLSAKRYPLNANRAAILVTGGFHTGNLAQLFKKNNISYITIMPNFKNQPGYECPYFKLLSGEKNLKIKEALPSILKQSLAIPDPLNKLMMRAIDEASRNAAGSTIAPPPATPAGIATYAMPQPFAGTPEAVPVTAIEGKINIGGEEYQIICHSPKSEKYHSYSVLNAAQKTMGTFILNTGGDFPILIDITSYGIISGVSEAVIMHLLESTGGRLKIQHIRNVKLIHVIEKVRAGFKSMSLELQYYNDSGSNINPHDIRKYWIVKVSNEGNIAKWLFDFEVVDNKLQFQVNSHPYEELKKALTVINGKPYLQGQHQNLEIDFDFSVNVNAFFNVANRKLENDARYRLPTATPPAAEAKQAKPLTSPAEDAGQNADGQTEAEKEQNEKLSPEIIADISKAANEAWHESYDEAASDLGWSSPDRVFQEQACRLVSKKLKEKLTARGYPIKELEYNKGMREHHFIVLEENGAYWVLDGAWQQFNLQKPPLPNKVLIVKAFDRDHKFDENIFKQALLRAGAPKDLTDIWVLPVSIFAVTLPAAPKPLAPSGSGTSAPELPAKDTGISLNNILDEIIRSAPLIKLTTGNSTRIRLKEDGKLYFKGSDNSQSMVRRLVGQAFFILLKNAIQDSSEGGEVSIKICKDGEYAVIELINSGIGIYVAGADEAIQKAETCVKGLPDGSLIVKSRGIDKGITARIRFLMHEKETGTPPAPAPGGSAIGKFVEIKPIHTDEQGKLLGVIENIDTKGRLDLSGLAQRRAPPAEVEKYIQSLGYFIDENLNISPHRQFLNQLISLFRAKLPKNVIITQEIKVGFFGTGRPGLLVINQDILDNPISLLHEMAEYLKNINPVIIIQMESLLNRLSITWLKQHENKYAKQGKRDYFINNKAHYIISAFTRQVFRESNARLTGQIKNAAAKRLAAPEMTFSLESEDVPGPVRALPRTEWGTIERFLEQASNKKQGEITIPQLNEKAGPSTINSMDKLVANIKTIISNPIQKEAASASIARLIAGFFNMNMSTGAVIADGDLFIKILSLPSDKVGAHIKEFKSQYPVMVKQLRVFLPVLNTAMDKESDPAGNKLIKNKDVEQVISRINSFVTTPPAPEKIAERIALAELAISRIIDKYAQKYTNGKGEVLKSTPNGVFAPSHVEDIGIMLDAAGVGPGVKFGDLGGGLGDVMFRAAARGADVIGWEIEEDIFNDSCKARDELKKTPDFANANIDIRHKNYLEENSGIEECNCLYWYYNQNSTATNDRALQIRLSNAKFKPGTRLIVYGGERWQGFRLIKEEIDTITLSYRIYETGDDGSFTNFSSGSGNATADTLPKRFTALRPVRKISLGNWDKAEQFAEAIREAQVKSPSASWYAGRGHVPADILVHQFKINLFPILRSRGVKLSDFGLTEDDIPSLMKMRELTADELSPLRENIRDKTKVGQKASIKELLAMPIFTQPEATNLKIALQQLEVRSNPLTDSEFKELTAGLNKEEAIVVALVLHPGQGKGPKAGIEIEADVKKLLGELDKPARDIPGVVTENIIQGATDEITRYILDGIPKENSQAVFMVITQLNGIHIKNDSKIRIPHNLQVFLKKPGLTIENKRSILDDVKDRLKDVGASVEIRDAVKQRPHIDENSIIEAAGKLHRLFDQNRDLLAIKIEADRSILLDENKTFPDRHIMWLLGMDQFLDGKRKFDAESRRQIANFLWDAGKIIDEIKKHAMSIERIAANFDINVGLVERTMKLLGLQAQPAPIAPHPAETAPVATVETIVKELSLPNEDIAKIKKMLNNPGSAEDKARIMEMLCYLSNVYGSSREVLNNLPGDVSAPRNILIPLSQKFCPIAEETSHARYQNLWKELRGILEKRGFTNLKVIFYDGTSEDLQTKLGKVSNATPENTIAYVDSELKLKASSLNRPVTIVNEKAPMDGGYISLVGHVTLGIGILDMVGRKELDRETALRIARLILAISGDLAATGDYNDPAKLAEMVKNGSLVIALPAVKNIDIDKNMGNHLLMESALKTSL